MLDSQDYASVLNIYTIHLCFQTKSNLE